ncbi:MAG TPA: RedB protein, partial [Myxococcales bacterium]|nr:RedB protein [Myxococcales bacterium]
LVGAGLYWFGKYKTTPGAQLDAPRLWPVASSVKLTPGRSSLLLFLHPQCDCSRASLEELKVILNGAPNASASIVVEQLDGVPLQGGTWQENIPGATVFIDKDGVEAKRFGARTSGQVDLYDAGGRLQFSGGITASRGHAGDNTGRQAVQDLLAGKPARWDSHAVFGCALVDAS